MAKQADEFMKRFPPETQSTPDYQVAELLVLDQLGTRSAVIDRGRALVKQGVYDAVIYQILVRRSLGAGLKDSAETFARDATQRWPELKNEFAALMTNAGKIE